jgi:cysteine desulfurase
MPKLPRKSPRKIYLDNASLTPTDERVSSVVTKYIKDEGAGKYGNPSSIYTAGVEAKKALESARATCALAINAHKDEIIFTAGGTEANNIAIQGVVEALIVSGKKYKDIHIIVSEIEHTSVLETALALKKKGVHVDMAPVKPNGIVDLDAFKKLLRPSTALVSIMMVNNEIGTIQPIGEIVKIVRDFRKKDGKNKKSSLTFSQYPLIHTDACQALLYLEINMEKLGVDLLTIDSNKIYGPHGVGALYIRRSAQPLIAPIIFGGGQEKNLRSGTENVPAIVGMAKAIEIATTEREREVKRLTSLRDYCFDKISSSITGLTLQGDRIQRIANNLNVSIPNVDHEFLVLELDVRGIMCSTKSACLRDADESYVLKAISGPSSSLRISVGRFTTRHDIDDFVKVLTKLCLRDYN